MPDSTPSQAPGPKPPEAPAGGPPEAPAPGPAPRRRAFLTGALTAGAAGAVAGVAGGYAYRATRPAPASELAMENSQAGLLPPVPFEGKYQAGILPQSQRSTAVIAFNATAKGRGELVDLFQAITARARFLTAGGTPPPVGIGGPPSDSGVLGPTVVPDGLTVTLGVGSALFDDRYGLPGTDEFFQPGLVMDYFDGNTVTGLWNYAQNYAMSDNNYDANFGPSTPGALNLISGFNGAGYAVNPTTGVVEPSPGSVSALNSKGLGTIYGDLDPAYDDCSNDSHTSTDPVGVMTGQNIGNMLNADHITWGWFQGGFAPTGTNSAGYAVCGSSHANIGGNEVQDYVPHHDPFQYYKSTSNPKHLPPTSEAAVGRTDQANHQYDISWFYKTLQDGNMPAVSFLKAPAYQDGHAGYSNPIDEQHFLVNTINQIEESKYWKSTAIIITYDDSDGWYDHQAPPIVNGSDTSADEQICNTVPMTLGTFDTRCGYGPRLPLLVVSPYTRDNYVSNNLTDQASITRFIEDNWLGGERIGGGSFDEISGSLYAKGGVLNFRVKPNFTRVILNPTTGAVVSG
jgi:phospholipase C